MFTHIYSHRMQTTQGIIKLYLINSKTHDALMRVIQQQSKMRWYTAFLQSQVKF